jgi:hypothetical protein
VLEVIAAGLVYWHGNGNTTRVSVDWTERRRKVD